MNTLMSWPGRTLVLVAAAVLFGPTAPAEGQAGPPVLDAEPVTLEQARLEAAERSLDVRAARARARAADAGRASAGAFRWPTVGAEAGAVVSDDPVAAFGGRLRQGRFTQADFDPALLNDPDALTDWSGAVGAEWAPLDLSAMAGLEAARLRAEAAGLGAAWARRAAVFRAEARYLEAVGAARRLSAAERTLEAADANLAVMERRAEEGLLTDADLLQARAARSGAEAAVIDAERIVADARARLGLALGWPAGRIPVPADSVFVLPHEVDRASLEARADLRASRAGVAAAEARARQARRARLPTLSGFARLETHSSDPFDGIRDDWTVGVQLRVPLFTGFRVGAEARAAEAMGEAAALDHEDRTRAARTEVAEARRGLEAATRGAEAARAGALAADEAARLVRRRFQEGLATTADLLDAEARADGLRTRAVQAELARHLAAARLAFLTDTDLDTDPRGGTDR